MSDVLDIAVYLAVTVHERAQRARACWRAYRNGLAVRVMLTLPPGMPGDEVDYAVLLIDPVTDEIAKISMKPRRLAVRVRTVAQDA
jgi:hypothetical protein